MHWALFLLIFLTRVIVELFIKLFHLYLKPPGISEPLQRLQKVTPFVTLNDFAVLRKNSGRLLLILLIFFLSERPPIQFLSHYVDVVHCSPSAIW